MTGWTWRCTCDRAGCIAGGSALSRDLAVRDALAHLERHHGGEAA